MPTATKFDWEKVEIETDRLLLKKLTPEIFTELFTSYSKQFIMDFLGLPNEKEWEKERAKAIDGYKTHDRSILAFTMVRKDNQQTIGRIGFHNWYQGHLRAELGYALSQEEHKRQGFMSEAVNTVLNYGFEAMHLNRIEAFVGPDNDASLRIIRKFGFEQEGYFKQHYLRNGIAEDSIAFALLKEDWKK